MADFAVCPHCRETVTVPPEAAADDRFLCPLCDRGFTAGEARLREDATPASRPVPAAASTKKLQVEFVSDAAERINAPPSSVLRRRNRRSNWFGQLIGIVGGGAIGLTIGYCLLLRIKGPEADFLEIRQHIPNWASGLPAEAEEPEEPPGPVFEDPPPFVPAPIKEAPIVPEPEPEPPETVPPPETSSTPAPPELPPDYLGPRHFQPRTSDELGDALVKVRDALGCENCRSTGFVNDVVVTGSRVVDGRKIETKQNKRVPCPVCGGKPKGKSLPEIYAALGDLAEVATFVEVSESDAMLPERRAAAERFLRFAVADMDQAQNLGRLGGAAWDDPATAGHGALFVGTVKEIEPRGKLFQTRLILLGAPHEVAVVGPRKPAFQTGDRVAILANIVDRPAEELIGYEGEEPRVAWGGLAQKVEDEPLKSP